MFDFQNKQITVLGLGNFGGGVAVTRWLVQQGAEVLVCDQSPPEKLRDSVEALADLPVKFRLGNDQLEQDFTEVDLVVASPAVAPANHYLKLAHAAGVAVTTEICLFVQRCSARVIGVTGTKGKSTTSTLLHRMLQTRCKSWLGGNIGGSLLADLSSIAADELVVLELSSFMLEHLGAMRWSPHVAVVTMVSVDHLDWHGSEEKYVDAKRKYRPLPKARRLGGAEFSERFGEVVQRVDGGPRRVVRHSFATPFSAEPGGRTQPAECPGGVCRRIHFRGGLGQRPGGDLRFCGADSSPAAGDGTGTV